MANRRDEATDEQEKIASARNAGLDEDVIAVSTRGRLGNAKSRGGFIKARAGNQLLQHARFCRREMEALNHGPDLDRRRNAGRSNEHDRRHVRVASSARRVVKWQDMGCGVCAGLVDQQHDDTRGADCGIVGLYRRNGAPQFLSALGLQRAEVSAELHDRRLRLEHLLCGKICVQDAALIFDDDHPGDQAVEGSRNGIKQIGVGGIGATGAAPMPFALAILSVVIDMSAFPRRRPRERR